MKLFKSSESLPGMVLRIAVQHSFLFGIVGELHYTLPQSQASSRTLNPNDELHLVPQREGQTHFPSPCTCHRLGRLLYILRVPHLLWSVNEINHFSLALSSGTIDLVVGTQPRDGECFFFRLVPRFYKPFESIKGHHWLL